MPGKLDSHIYGAKDQDLNLVLFDYKLLAFRHKLRTVSYAHIDRISAQRQRFSNSRTGSPRSLSLKGNLCPCLTLTSFSAYVEYAAQVVEDLSA
jgi:hypothetical protein